MEKHRLSLEQLAVESFETAEGPEERGTVEGYQASEPYVCHTYEFCTCDDGVSEQSCIYTCWAAGSGCGGGGSQGFTCYPNNTCNGPATCDLPRTCGGCTAYTQEC